MNQEKNSKATISSGRMFENCVFQNPGLSVLCPDGAEVAAGRKNKETHRLFIFFRRQRSKVIFRVTRNYLALRGSSLFHPLPMVAGSRSQWTTFFLHAPDGCISGLSGTPAVSSPDGRFPLRLSIGNRYSRNCFQFP